MPLFLPAIGNLYIKASCVTILIAVIRRPRLDAIFVILWLDSKNVDVTCAKRTASKRGCLVTKDVTHECR